MDDLIEFIIELVLEIGSEVASNQKISKWIRYPILIIFTFLGLLVIGGIIVLGISLIQESILLSLILITIGITLIICAIFKFKKIYKEKYFEKLKKQ